MKIIQVKKSSSEVRIAVEKFTRQLIEDNSFVLSEAYFQELLDSESSYLFLLLDEQDIAGMLTVGIYKSPTGSKAWIEDVVVDANYQGQGLGRMIVQHAIDFVKTEGVESLMLTSNPTRVAANKLYQSIGFEQKVTNVYRMEFLKS